MNPGMTNPDTLTAPGSRTTAGLLTAAMLTAAAMVADSAAADVSVTVDAETISMQVCQYAGDEATRAATVAVYAHVLHTKVTRRTSREHTWIEARGTAAGHPVHVWTVADPQRVR